MIATLEGFSSDDVDAYAVESQARAALAQAEGRFDKSIAPVHRADGTLALDHDEHPRPGTTLEALAGLTPSFEQLGTTTCEGFDVPFDEMCKTAYPQIDRVEHVHHGGNSSGVVDGAAAIVLASDEYAEVARALSPGCIVMHAVAGTEPVIMLTAPGPATEKVIALAGMTLDDIDLFEVNEAFAAVPLKTMRDLGPRPRQGERQRWRHRARSPDRRHRGDADPNRPRRTRTARPEHRSRDHVHRRRHGNRHHHRTCLTRSSVEVQVSRTPTNLTHLAR